jgi:hypothetical protein
MGSVKTIAAAQRSSTEDRSDITLSPPSRAMIASVRWGSLQRVRDRGIAREANTIQKQIQKRVAVVSSSTVGMLQSQPSHDSKSRRISGGVTLVEKYFSP